MIDPSFKFHQCLLAGKRKKNSMLVAKGSAGVAPEVNLGEHLKCMPPPSATLALKPRGDVTRSPKQGY